MGGLATGPPSPPPARRAPALPGRASTSVSPWRIPLLVTIVVLVSAGAAVSHAARTVDAILAEVRRATARYLDVERARVDGFVQLSGMELGLVLLVYSEL